MNSRTVCIEHMRLSKIRNLFGRNLFVLLLEPVLQDGWSLPTSNTRAHTHIAYSNVAFLQLLFSKYFWLVWNSSAGIAYLVISMVLLLLYWLRWFVYFQPACNCMGRKQTIKYLAMLILGTDWNVEINIQTRKFPCEGKKRKGPSEMNPIWDAMLFPGCLEIGIVKMSKVWSEIQL